MKTGAAALILNEGLHPVTMDTGCPLRGEGHSSSLPFTSNTAKIRDMRGAKAESTASKEGGGGQLKQALQQAVEMEPYRSHVSI